MVQHCEAVIVIYNVENPSTIRDYLNAYFKQPEHQNMLGEKVICTDVWRDNDEVYIELHADVKVDYFPGCPGSYWDPPEYPYVEGCFTEEDFLNLIDKALSENFEHEEYTIDMYDCSIPDEIALLDKLAEDSYYDEF